MMPIADVRDATVARFAAGRFRSTYRSLRPLLPDGGLAEIAKSKPDNDGATSHLREPRTQADLDDEAKAFALGLIENWVHDPSNVRLLRIGLDLWPAKGVLESVLGLLRRFTEKGGPRGEPRRVARYCLAEIFRAGATETGFVESEEAMPAGIEVVAYRQVLVQEAARLVTLSGAMLPWYLRQQVLLFLAACDPATAPVHRKGDNPETSHYRELILYLKGENEGLSGTALATNAILVRRSFRGQQSALSMAGRALPKASLEAIAERDPSFALEIIESTPDLFDRLSPRRRDDLCLKPLTRAGDGVRLTEMLMLPLKAPRVVATVGSRPLRACVMQTVIPDDRHYESAMAAGDLALNGRDIRRQHRGHLSAALAVIRQLLYLRDTHLHLHRDGRLDWLILPELSVHPRDVATHLIPFARAHRTIILAGLSYEKLFAGQPLINSALWVIPTWSSAHGLQVITRRQGKQHLAPQEEQFNAGDRVIQDYRPCQWLIDYEWSAQQSESPLRLTASVCYDATDPRLAADLQRQSDVFAVPALNRDVVTFDQMALALHYHMFQMVIVANNGRYGGSNAYAPYRQRYLSQIFHLHGQPQASAAFLEIDDIGVFIRRVEEARRQESSETTPSSPRTTWKYPPAGRG